MQVKLKTLGLPGLNANTVKQASSMKMTSEYIFIDTMNTTKQIKERIDLYVLFVKRGFLAMINCQLILIEYTMQGSMKLTENLIMTAEEIRVMTEVRESEIMQQQAKGPMHLYL